jgi:hypothetical protein
VSPGLLKPIVRLVSVCSDGREEVINAGGDGRFPVQPHRQVIVDAETPVE